MNLKNSTSNRSFELRKSAYGNVEDRREDTIEMHRDSSNLDPPEFDLGLFKSFLMLSMKASMRDEMLRKRRHAIEELIQSEEVYVKLLSLLFEKYIKPLSHRKIITESDITIVFGNIIQIRDTNKSFLSSLRNLSETTPLSLIQVNDVFYLFGAFFKVYTDYITNHAMGSRKVDQLCANKRKFRNLLKQNENAPEFDGLDIHDLLILPVQRIPRYELIIQSILSHTPSDMLDHSMLPKALRAFRDLSGVIDQSARESEELMEVNEQQQRFVYGDKMGLVNNGRRLLKAETLTMFSRHGFPQECEFLLFNDIFLYADKTSDGLVLKEYFAMHNFVIKDLADEDNQPLSRIEVLSPQNSFILVCPDEISKNDWLNGFNSAIELYREGTAFKQILEVRQEHRKNLNLVWADYKASETCFLCKVRFNSLRKRQNCTRCGILTCSSCSTLVVGRFANLHDPSPPRVCDVCRGDPENPVNYDLVRAASEQYLETKQAEKAHIPRTLSSCLFPKTVVPCERISPMIAIADVHIDPSFIDMPLKASDVILVEAIEHPSGLYYGLNTRVNLKGWVHKDHLRPVSELSPGDLNSNGKLRDRVTDLKPDHQPDQEENVNTDTEMKHEPKSTARLYKAGRTISSDPSSEMLEMQEGDSIRILSKVLSYY